jgi:nucleotidyltransferase/DNA polymerase involved in DNA repair
MDEIMEDFYKEIVGERIYFKTITVKLRYQDFETHTHSKSLFSPTNRKDTIEDLARKLVLPFLQTNKKIRLIGVRVSSLVYGYGQKALMD